MHGNDCAVTRIKTPQRGIDELAVRERTCVVGIRRRIDRAQLDLHRAPSPAPQEVEADVDGEAMQPGLEPVGIAKSRQVPPGADERLLDPIARELGVPEDQAGGRVQPRERRVDEQGKGVMIAPPRAFDELSLVHCCLSWRDHGGRVRQRMTSGGRESFTGRRGRRGYPRKSGTLGATAWTASTTR